jgi:serine/threonine-protein kinase
VRYCEVCRASFQATAACPRDKVRLRADILDPLLDRVLGGRYRVLERIAAGGMGQIYRAAHSRIASLVVVKVLYGELTHVPEMRARFQREAEAASCLQSRHIVRVLDFGESDEGLLYLAMEELRGPSLSGVLARDGGLRQERAVGIARQVVRGLSHAHERGIVHRDLKPDNVMLVAEDDEEEVVKLLDFGIAQIRAGARLTSVGQFLGTPHYMAPEQFAGADVDARADLYSLGVMMYEMLAGSPPFDGSTAHLAMAHAETPAPRISSRRGDVSPALDEIIHHLLAKAPAGRFASARAVGEALKSVAASPSPGSRPAPSAPLPAIARDVLDSIRTAIQFGAPLYNAGDHAACATLYRDTAEQIILRGARGGCQVAVAARLRAALGRAGGMPSSTHAAWELRYAFDDLLRCEGALVDRTTADPLDAEISIALAIAASRYAAQDLEAVGAFYLELIRGISAWLRIEGRDEPTADWLARAASRADEAGGGARAVPELARALETLHATLKSSLARARAASLVPSLPVHASPVQGLQRSDEVARRIAAAIGLGAPAYNAGDVAGCVRIYRRTATELVALLAGEAGGGGVLALLRAALDEASRSSEDGGAWALRRAFDEILGAPRA